MSNNNHKDHFIIYFFSAIGVLLLSAVVAGYLKPEKHTITLSEPMSVIPVGDGVNHWAYVKVEDRVINLEKGDELIVTTEPVRGIVAISKGGAYTHMKGWLLSGTMVEVPFADLKKQKGWQSWRAGKK